jgi:hypothetical protein
VAVRLEFNLSMARSGTHGFQELAPERRKQPAFDPRGIAHLIESLREDEKCLLS